MAAARHGNRAGIALEQLVEAADVMIVFLSGSTATANGFERSEYMRSTNCLRELRSAIEKGKPIVFVLETDPAHGAVSMDVHRRDCPPELRHALDEQRVVPWYRVKAFAHASLSLNTSRSILVCGLSSEQGRAGAHGTMRFLSTTTTRKRIFGGAWRPSSLVRRRSCMDRLPSHAADLVLCARVAGPFSRPLSSQPMIKGALVAYGLRSLRGCAARGCVCAVVMTSAVVAIAQRAPHYS